MSTDIGELAEVGGADEFAIGEPGRAATQLGPGLPTRFPDCADHELSECRVPGASIRAASMRGLLHRYRGQPRQDRFSVVYDAATMTVVLAVCDGVGQFPLSQEAAAFVAVDVPRAFLAHREWQRAMADVNQRLGEFVAAAPSRPHLDEVPADVRMATTLVAAAICVDPANWHASVAWTDDSSVWSLREGHWQNLTPDPDPTKNADGLYSGRVRALPDTSPRLATAELVSGSGSLFLMTDGVGSPLESSEQVRETLANWWATPPNLFTFAQQVTFARKGHMDDRTVIGVWFEPEPT